MQARRPFNVGRLAAHIAVVVSGVVTVIGSGGDFSLGFPSIDWDEPLPPPVYVSVTPSRPTVQAGTIVQFEATTTNAALPISYQWRRDGVEIRGATGPTFVVGGAQVGDDGALFQVTVTASNGSATGSAALLVSPHPPVVFEDSEFPVSRWTVSAEPDPAQAGPTHAESQGTDGNPGLFRSIANQLTPGPSGLLLRHYAGGATYDPATLGAIYTLDLSMDCRRTGSTPDIVMHGTPFAFVLLEQGDRTFEPRAWDQYCRFAWSSRQQFSLGEDGFRIRSGPPCGEGERCPDFSAAGAPLRFGFATWAGLSSGSPPGTVTLGVDNWSVTVWKR